MSPPELLSRFKDARVLVVGDVMLDRFVYARSLPPLAGSAGAGPDGRSARR